jgi:ATP-dependent Lon protease
MKMKSLVILKKFKELIEECEMPEEAEKAAMEEVERLESIPDSSPEYNVTRTYLNWMTQFHGINNR